jgi:hypothetical protein
MARTRRTAVIDPATGKPLPNGVIYRGPLQYRARKLVNGHRVTKTFTKAAAVPMKRKVSHTPTCESQPLVNWPIIFGAVAMRAIRKMSGTATTPLMTAVIINAFTGSMPTKVVASLSEMIV